jgi:hypothetical protein
MKTEAEQLRDELSRLVEEQNPTDPTLPPEVPISLIQRVVAYLQQQRARGRTLAQCALELGVPKGRLHYWLYQRHRPRPSPDKPPPLVRPVQVSSELVPVLDGVPERRYILRSPAGWELRELTLKELVELLRSLT